MIQPVTLLGAGLCLGVLYQRYKSQPKDAPRRGVRQKMKTAKILFAALLVWLTIGYTLRHMIVQIDGADHEPSVMERIVVYLSKL